jgi:hypothetical protein
VLIYLSIRPIQVFSGLNPDIYIYITRLCLEGKLSSKFVSLLISAVADYIFSALLHISTNL